MSINYIPLQIVREVVAHFPAVIPHLSPTALSMIKAGGEYSSVRSSYAGEIYNAVYDYLTGDKPVTSFVNAAKRSFTEAQAETMEIAYVEGGGELPFDEETSAWLVEMQQAEFSHIEELFARLKAEWEGLDPAAEADSRAQGYASTLDQIHSEAKARGAKNKMLTFVGDDGAESCPDCQRMKGKRHRASWWVEHDMIPGSSSYECGGWNCQHILVDDNGDEFTL